MYSSVQLIKPGNIGLVQTLGMPNSATGLVHSNFFFFSFYTGFFFFKKKVVLTFFKPIHQLRLPKLGSRDMQRCGF